MPTDRFFIAPYDQESGLQTDVRPWLVPDQAFSTLNNAYVFRGRVRKRFGSTFPGNELTSRLRVNVGEILGSNIIGNVRTITNDPGMPTSIGQAFSVFDTATNQDVVFTVYANFPGVQPMLRTVGAPGVGAVFNLTTSDFAITLVGAVDHTPVYFYPAMPVMGLVNFASDQISYEFLMGFDQRFAYKFTATGWQRLPNEVVAQAAHWSGSNSDFFWGCTYTGVTAADKVYFVTNFNQLEPNYMRQYQPLVGWNNFRPQISATPDYLNCARIIVPFHNRLVCLNTWEGPAALGAQVNYSNRCRYSQVGSPLAVDSWRQDIAGRGNAIDASTAEAIVTAEFVKDRLIVYFERSTWELAYTGNQAYPFSWQQINTELGAESTFSIIPFDKYAIGVGNVGIHACNGSNVERIDTKIPDAVFAFHNVDAGVNRVHGIRDYFLETLYWTIPGLDASAANPFPTKVLVFNYKTSTWAFNDDSITAFGYLNPNLAVTWDSTIVTWDSNVEWGGAPLQALFKHIIAGNQEGYTFICDSNNTTNVASLQITNLTVLNNVVTVTSMNHNLRDGDYIYFEGISGTGNLALINDKIFLVSFVADANTLTFAYHDAIGTNIAGVYSGGGRMARVSKIDIKTKEYNFYAQQGRNAYVSKVDFLVDATDAGQLQVDFYVSTGLTSQVAAGSLSGALVGTSTLDTAPYLGEPADATRLWHPLYFQADGEVVQFQLTMNNDQMEDTNIRNCDFQLHALCVFATPSSSRLQ
jgi:hypothetical protein